MPLVRFDLNKNAPVERIRIASEVVYKAMIEVANVPIDDKFQVVTRHEPDEIIYPQDGYLDMQYSADLIIIQVTWVGGGIRGRRGEVLATSRTKSMTGGK